MIRHIYKQIWNRRRSNTGLLIELLLVFCLIWYIVDFFFLLFFNYNLKNHRDFTHTWEVKMELLPEDHPDFNLLEDNPANQLQNFTRILETIKNHPLVESVGLSFSGSAPGKGSYYGMGLINPADSTHRPWRQRVLIDTRYDFFSVFRHTRDNAQARVRMNDYRWHEFRGIIINNSFEKDLFREGESAIGKIVQSGDPVTEYTVIGVIDDTKRFNHQRPGNRIYLPQQLDSTNFHYSEIVIRSKDHLSVAQFKSVFTEEIANSLRIGNFYFSNLLYFPKINADTVRMFGEDNKVLTHFLIALFLLINIILCLVGTFWYRLNVRKNEIGLREALGSSRSHIVKLFCLEAFCLFTIILIPAFIIELQIINLDFTQTSYLNNSPKYWVDNPYLRFIATNLITFILLEVVVAFSVWIPAKRAAAITPSDALRYE